MGVLAGLLLIALILGAIVAAIGGAFLGHVPSFIFWLVPVNPNGLAAKLVTGGVLALLAYGLLAGWSRRGDSPAAPMPDAESRRREQSDRDADEFAWWMTDGPGSY